MGDYTYLDDLTDPSDEGFGTAAYADVGTEDDQLPTYSSIVDLIEASAIGAVGILSIRFLTTSQSITVNDATTAVFFIIVGGGGGGGYGGGSYLADDLSGGPGGGGAGGVSIGLTSVSGGDSVGVTIGSGGYGGTSSSGKGTTGTASRCAGLESGGGEGGGRSDWNDATILEGKGGSGSADFSNGILWSKQGGWGNAPINDEEGFSVAGQGGNPWNQSTTYPGRGAWLMMTRGLVAHYGSGGASGEGPGALDGKPGADGIVIFVELS